ncbi:diguanylate cyclase domain-containing protein [Limnospira fusiformis]|uniref:diguanylate cyclase domain-containing protein n=1 Tax=Limnospira fusiformis TaxID=54297 RepID=UPI0003125149
MILCDVDYLKKYNDTYGHLAGDNCLIRVAQAIQESAMRPGDLVARYGGGRVCHYLIKY